MVVKPPANAGSINSGSAVNGTPLIANGSGGSSFANVPVSGMSSAGAPGAGYPATADGAGGFSFTNGVVAGAMAVNGRSVYNILTNPGLNFAQQQAPGTLTTIADTTYGPDGWLITRSAADVQYQRQSNSGTGWGSANSGLIKKITNPGRVVIYQPLEALLTAGLQNQSVNLQVTCQASGTPNFRLALINFSGTADAVKAAGTPISNFATSPMGLNASFTYLFSVLYTGISTSPQQFFVTFSPIPASAISNLIVAIMIEGSMAVNDTFQFGEASLTVGDGATRPWIELSGPEDVARIERYYEKSYDTDVNIDTAATVGGYNATCPGASPVFQLKYRQRKVKTPVVTLYSTVGAPPASTKWRDVTGAADLSAASQNIGLQGLGVKLTAATTGNEILGHYTLDSTL